MSEDARTPRAADRALPSTSGAGASGSPREPSESERERERERDWGFPEFARNFPRDSELDALVLAFARGDYATVRARAPKLAAHAEDPAVRRAASLLRARIEPDPFAKILVLLTAAILVVLTAYWVTHDGKDEAHAPSHSAPAAPR